MIPCGAINQHLTEEYGSLWMLQKQQNLKDRLLT